VKKNGKSLKIMIGPKPGWSGCDVGPGVSTGRCCCGPGVAGGVGSSDRWPGTAVPDVLCLDGL